MPYQWQESLTNQPTGVMRRLNSDITGPYANVDLYHTASVMNRLLMRMNLTGLENYIFNVQIYEVTLF